MSITLRRGIRIHNGIVSALIDQFPRYNVLLVSPMRPTRSHLGHYNIIKGIRYHTIPRPLRQQINYPQRPHTTFFTRITKHETMSHLPEPRRLRQNFTHNMNRHNPRAQFIVTRRALATETIVNTRWPTHVNRNFFNVFYHRNGTYIIFFTRPHNFNHRTATPKHNRPSQTFINSINRVNNNRRNLNIRQFTSTMRPKRHLQLPVTISSGARRLTKQFT